MTKEIRPYPVTKSFRISDEHNDFIDIFLVGSGVFSDWIRAKIEEEMIDAVKKGYYKPPRRYKRKKK